jgi:hypothetical protein
VSEWEFLFSEQGIKFLSLEFLFWYETVRQTNAVTGLPFSGFGILVMCRYLVGLLGRRTGPSQRRCLHGTTQTLVTVQASDRLFMNLSITHMIAALIL